MPTLLRQLERERRRLLNAPERLAAVDRYRGQLSDHDSGLQALAGDAAAACGAPFALITLVDRHHVWVKASVGVQAREAPASTAICTTAIGQGGLFLVPDATTDPRTNTSLLVTGPMRIAAYAGAPLVTDDGFPVGMVCVLDVKARPAGFGPDEGTALQRLASATMKQLETIRQQNIGLRPDRDAASALEQSLSKLRLDLVE